MGYGYVSWFITLCVVGENVPKQWGKKIDILQKFHIWRRQSDRGEWN
jgi:hypothetical protein